MNKEEILQAAFDEGKKHIGAKGDAIYDLAEEYIWSKPYVDIEMDEAIYEAFINGATTENNSKQERYENSSK